MEANKEMFINALVPENIRVAILDNGRLDAFFEQFHLDFRTRGNIYLGRIVNVESSLDACFVDYGAERHGFLPLSEILPVFFRRKPAKPNGFRINEVMDRGQMLMVQVDKEAVGTKGARLTTAISLAGRYLVLLPNSDLRGVSRKIEDDEQRRTYREMFDKLSPPKGMGLIVRTAGLGQPKRSLSRDLNYLIRLWSDIGAKAKATKDPVLLHADADIVQRVLRDYYTDDIVRVWIDDPTAQQFAEKFFKLLMPRQHRVLKLYDAPTPLFSHFGIEEQIDKIRARKVELPSGGSLVIDQTEALVAVDVNSGKMKGRRGQEDTAYETNLEAAREIARQLRLRDMGGIVVIDFIDMSNSAHDRALERELKNALKSDKARFRVSKISTFGLCTLTRQRLGKSIQASGYRPCPVCGGEGVLPDPDSVSVRLLRRLRTAATTGKVRGMTVHLSPDLAEYVQNRYRGSLLAIEHECDVRLDIVAATDVCGQEEKIVFENRPADVVAPKADQKPEQKPTSVLSNERPPATDTPPVKRKRRRRKKKSVSDRQPVTTGDPQAQKHDGPSQDSERPKPSDAPRTEPAQEPGPAPNAENGKQVAAAGMAGTVERKKRRRRKRRPRSEADKAAGPRPEDSGSA